jgi:hypothetical protein
VHCIAPLCVSTHKYAHSWCISLTVFVVGAVLAKWLHLRLNACQISLLKSNLLKWMWMRYTLNFLFLSYTYILLLYSLILSCISYSIVHILFYRAYLVLSCISYSIVHILFYRAYFILSRMSYSIVHILFYRSSFFRWTLLLKLVESHQCPRFISTSNFLFLRFYYHFHLTGPVQSWLKWKGRILLNWKQYWNG